MDITRLRQIVTLGALCLALAHIFWPALAIDAITLGLLVIAVVPWLAPLIKSLELPGGWKIELQDVQQAAERVVEAGLVAEGHTSTVPSHSFLLVAEHDPNLALAGLRIEVERRLRTLCETKGVRAKPLSVRQMLRALDKAGVLTAGQSSALNDMSDLLNSAVHGASVEPRAAAWAMEIAPALLDSLDRLIVPNGQTVFVQESEPLFAHEGDLWINAGDARDP